MRTAAELRQEANELRQNPFNRLSFYYVDDRARRVWAIPRAETWEEGWATGRAMAQELLTALAEDRRRGQAHQFHYGHIVVKVAQKIQDHGVLVGFQRGLDDIMNHAVPWFDALEVPAVPGRRVAEAEVAA